MEILAILLIFSLGVILLLACFVGGIAFVFNALRSIVVKLFGKEEKK